MKLSTLELMSIACSLLSMNVSYADIKKPENGVHEEHAIEENKQAQTRGLMNIKEDTQADIHAYPVKNNSSFEQNPDQKQIMKETKTRQDN